MTACWTGEAPLHSRLSNSILFCIKSLTLNISVKGGSKVWVLGQEAVCNSGPYGPNDFKFCMQGAFVGYF